MAMAILCGKALHGCETQCVTNRQMRALRSLIATSMCRSKESQAAGPFMLHFRDGQYEPELYRTRHATGTIEVPPKFGERRAEAQFG